MKTNSTNKIINSISALNPPYFLLIETSTEICSVALAEGELVLASRTIRDFKSHASKLLPLVDEVLKQVGFSADSLHAVAVSGGPGSYTGLRIGVSTAKGLCYAHNLPLLAIDPLHAMASAFTRLNASQLVGNDLLIPMIDARRMEVYAAIFDNKANKLSPTKAMVLTMHSFDQWAGHRLWLIGDGAKKTTVLFGQHSNIHIVADFLPSAEHLALLAFGQYQNQQFVDVAYYEPFYLKDFVAGIPKVKGLQ